MDKFGKSSFISASKFLQTLRWDGTAEYHFEKVWLWRPWPWDRWLGSQRCFWCFESVAHGKTRIHEIRRQPQVYSDKQISMVKTGGPALATFKSNEDFLGTSDKTPTNKAD